MAKKPDPPKPTTWTIYKIAAKAVQLGTVEAADETTAVEKAVTEFKVPATKLMAGSAIVPIMTRVQEVRRRIPHKPL